MKRFYRKEMYFKRDPLVTRKKLSKVYLISYYIFIMFSVHKMISNHPDPKSFLMHLPPDIQACFNHYSLPLLQAKKYFNSDSLYTSTDLEN